MLRITAIKPLFTSILTTGEKYTEDVRENGIIVANKGDLKAYQKVVSVGSSVRDIKPGDNVMIDLMHFAVMKLDPNSIKRDMDLDKVVKWNIPWVIVDDADGKPQNCLLISDRDVKFVFEGKEVKDNIIIPDKPLIINN